MKTKFRLNVTVSLVAGVLLALFLAGCGGGGGGGGAVSSSSGSVALYIKDAPVDDYDNIYIAIEEVSLIPAEDSKPSVVIFKSSNPKGYVIDLLDLRDQDMLFTVKKEVPAGLYEKIRLKIKDIYPVPKDGAANACDRDNMEIKLPSGKIDLNPQGGIYVETGRTLSIRLDIDANKSIQIHPAGKSGKCVFRPVVFVDIEPAVAKPQTCLRLLKGTIAELIYREQAIVGFVLDLPGERGPLNVYAQDAVIFDEMGLPIPITDLAAKVGMAVSVRGRLDENDRFQAKLVVIGQVLVLKGTVGAAVDVDGKFPLMLLPGQEFVGNEVKVALSEETFILMGCDQPVDRSYIQKDMQARVVGKYDTENEQLQAVAVFLQPVSVTGKLEAIETTDGVRTITVRTESGAAVEVVMPKSVPPMLEGDGVIPDDLFACAIGKDVRVLLDPEKPVVMTALEVRVQPDTFKATVQAVYYMGWYESTIEAKDEQNNDLTIHVEPTATILRFLDDPLAPNPYQPIALDDIQPGEAITVFGIPDCTRDGVDTSAFIVLVFPATV